MEVTCKLNLTTRNICIISICRTPTGNFTNFLEMLTVVKKKTKIRYPVTYIQVKYFITEFKIKLSYETWDNIFVKNEFSIIFSNFVDMDQRIFL